MSNKNEERRREKISTWIFRFISKRWMTCNSFVFSPLRMDHYWIKIHPSSFLFQWNICISRIQTAISLFVFPVFLWTEIHIHSLLFNNPRVTWRAFVWETFQAKPRQQFRELFLFVDKNTLKQPRELLLFHIIIFNVSLDMYEMPFSSCGRITFFVLFLHLQHGFC